MAYGRNVASCDPLRSSQLNRSIFIQVCTNMSRLSRLLLLRSYSTINLENKTKRMINSYIFILNHEKNKLLGGGTQLMSQLSRLLLLRSYSTINLENKTKRIINSYIFIINHEKNKLSRWGAIQLFWGRDVRRGASKIA